MTFNMGTPEYIWVSLVVFSLFCEAVMDGKPRTGKYSLALRMFNTGIAFWIAYAGGFFE